MLEPGCCVLAPAQWPTHYLLVLATGSGLLTGDAVVLLSSGFALPLGPQHTEGEDGIIILI